MPSSTCAWRPAGSASFGSAPISFGTIVPPTIAFVALAFGACLSERLVPFAFAQEWTSAGGPAGGQVRTITIENGVCLAGTIHGLHRSPDQGATWELVPLEPTPNVLVADAISDGSRVFIATALGIFASSDQGESWARSDGGIEGVAIEKLAVGDDALYALSDAIFGSSNLFRSTDGGDTWGLISTPPSPFSAIAEVGGVLVAGSQSFLTMFRSTDGGDTWQEADSGLPAIELYEAMVSSNGVVYAGSDHSGMFRTTDAGLSWSPINDGITQPFASVTDVAADGETVLAATWGDGMFRTSDGGLNWTPANTGLPGGWGAYLFSAAIEGANSLAGLLMDGVYRSTNAGASWFEPETGPTGTSPRSMVRSAAGTTIVTTGSDRIFRTTDAGDTWSNTQSGIPPQAQLIALGKHDDVLFAGTQYEGIVRSLDDGMTWAAANTGYPIYNGTAGNQYREVGAFVSAGGAIFVGTGEGTEFINGNFQLTGEGVYRSTNDGASWHPVNNGFPIIGTDSFGENRYDPVVAMGMGSGAIFASTFARGIFRSTDGGGSWNAVNAGLPQNGSLFPEFSDIVDLDGVVYAGSIGFAAGSGGLGLFRSTNQGASWTLANNGIPVNRRVHGLHVDGGTLYASVGAASTPLDDDGVYRSTDNGASWEKLGVGVEPLGARALLAVDLRLLVGTNGFGAWKLDLLDPASVPESPVDVSLAVGNPVPNPVQSRSIVSFELSAPERVRLALYDANGRLCRVLHEGSLEAGTHRATLEAGNLPQGVYWLRLSPLGGVGRLGRSQLEGRPTQSRRVVVVK